MALAQSRFELLLAELNQLADDSMFVIRWYDCGTYDHDWAQRRLGMIRQQRTQLQSALTELAVPQTETSQPKLSWKAGDALRVSGEQYTTTS